ncbi:hypothetical protein KEM48_011620 [Puccinia striiformis f. sp. tritici PST-130]|nr:hypothetical protein KEM48_011620 [Puccinia striiformis f. sp. tritici PST-130]
MNIQDQQEPQAQPHHQQLYKPLSHPTTQISQAAQSSLISPSTLASPTDYILSTCLLLLNPTFTPQTRPLPLPFLSVFASTFPFFFFFNLSPSLSFDPIFTAPTSTTFTTSTHRQPF